MRVLHIGKYFPPAAGGIERFTADLAEAQARAGLSTAVLAHSASPRAWQWSTAANPRLAFVRSYGQALFVPLSPGWPFAMHLCLREFGPDLLHLHLPNPSAFWLLLSPAAKRVPWVVHWHADVPLDVQHRGLRLAYPLYAGFESAMLSRARRIIATSQRYADASPPLAPHRRRVRVVPLGVAAAPTPGQAPQWPNGDRLKVLAVGRLSFYKGFEYLLKALHGCPAASLVLIGGGEREAALRQLLEALNLRDRVRILGAVDDHTLEAAYRSCDVLCLSSIDRSEAFGMVLIEAMRAGKPVVAADVPGSGVGVVVSQGQNGMLVPVADAQALSTALQELSADRALRHRLGANGRQCFERFYGIDAVAEALSLVYAEALALGPFE